MTTRVAAAGGSSSERDLGQQPDDLLEPALQGTSKGQSEAVISGEKLALKQAGSKVGKFNLKYVSLDDSTAQNPGTADEGQTAQNARKAVQDKTTIFYLGEFNSGGSKVSIPILNKAGIPQISPSNTYVGLTVAQPPGTEPGEPEKYYPTKTRTYARVVPKDDIQGAALVATMKEDGCKSVHIFNDKTTYGAGLGKNIESAAKEQGLTVEGNDGTDKNAPNYRSLAAKVKADCFVGSGVTGENYVQVFKDVAAANKTAKLYGPDGVAEKAFTNAKEGGIPADVAARTKVTVATLGLEEFKKRNNPQAEKFFADFDKEYNDNEPRPVRDLRLRDDEARSRHAEGRGRQGQRPLCGLQAAVEETKNRQSVLGEYSIDKNGDTSLTDYGLYVIKGGEPTFSKVIKAQHARQLGTA